MKPTVFIPLALGIVCFILAAVFYPREKPASQISYIPTPTPIIIYATPEPTVGIEYVPTPEPTPLEFQISRPVAGAGCVWYKAFIPAGEYFPLGINLIESDWLDVLSEINGSTFYIKIGDEVFGNSKGERQEVSISGQTISQQGWPYYDKHIGEVSIKTLDSQWFAIYKKIDTRCSGGSRASFDYWEKDSTVRKP